MKLPVEHVASALAHLTVAAQELQRAATLYSADWAAELCESAWHAIIRLRDDVWAKTAARWSLEDLSDDQNQQARMNWQARRKVICSADQHTGSMTTAGEQIIRAELRALWNVYNAADNYVELVQRGDEAPGSFADLIGALGVYRKGTDT